MQPIVLHSFAKINFYLDVIDQRADGFNNIETLFQTVSLCDTLSIEARAEGLCLHCDDAALAAEPDNLVLRAGRALLAHAGETRGAALRLQKRIPIAAGLAGGSGDAAAALVGLNLLWDLGLSPETLAELGLALGSDVPYCLRGGTAMATGRGEELRALPEVATTWLVLVHPPVGVSAAWVYRHPGLERSDETRVDGCTPQFSRAMELLRAGNVPAAVFNRMESVVFEAHPRLSAWKARLLALGCTAAAMSGSGPTLFGVCVDEAHAREVAKTFDAAPTTVVYTVGQGVEIAR